MSSGLTAFEDSFTQGILLDTVTDLCKERGITIKALEKELKFGNGTIRRWDTSKPAISAVVKVACYFDVSVDYLLGLSPYKQQETKNLTAWDLGLSEVAATMLKELSQSNNTSQRLKLRSINRLLEQDRDDSSGALSALSRYLFVRANSSLFFKISYDGLVQISNDPNFKLDENTLSSCAADDIVNEMFLRNIQLHLESLRRAIMEEEEADNGKLQDNN